jgi:hypothetical protein
MARPSRIEVCSTGDSCRYVASALPECLVVVLNRNLRLWSRRPKSASACMCIYPSRIIIQSCLRLSLASEIHSMHKDVRKDRAELALEPDGTNLSEVGADSLNDSAIFFL